MKIAKIHSLGNDFLIIDEKVSGKLEERGSFARKICERHTGVGADGLLLIHIEDKKNSIVHFRVFNADGTEAELSGNGLRCAAAYLYYKEKIESPHIIFNTPAGKRNCELILRDNNFFKIKIEMGVPHLSSKDIPFDDGSVHETIIDYPLTIQGKVYPVTLVNLGNPHCAIFVDHFPARIEWHQIGREIELHPFFPNRINVEFIRVMNRGEIEVFFWERGVGETLSSGSGSCAAAVASILKDQTDKKVSVRTTMGKLTVEWEKDSVYQIGPSQIIFHGEYLV
ncbi:MAG: diaminopimelate epimerase [Acidobacteria bacterium]|nr:diaminopimelate epimerase [Acidobacteriota bacterium]MBU1474125.1 diaminopimelate epimerase [Acidobacteriota bacterium]MBU2438599.1 diaminopimelate epimerase [Acidobacteriota bacterium]